MHDPGSAGVESALDSMPLLPLRWPRTFRIVPNYPPIEQLENISPELQAAVIAELAELQPELLGNPRFLPMGRWPKGPGASRIITSFTFSRPGRFNDESFAAFYGAESLATAIRETVHHVIDVLRDSNAPPQTLPPRLVLTVHVDAANVVDARTTAYRALYAEHYTESRRFGRMVRDRGYDGIRYRSVRRAGGECVAIYDPATLSRCREERELVYRYENGTVQVSEVHFSGP
jgi:RES domain